MRKVYFVYIILLITSYENYLLAQSNLVNSAGAKVIISAGTVLKLNNLKNDGTNSAITNAGTLSLQGNLNQFNTATYTGTGLAVLELVGTSQQTIDSDAPININRLSLNNSTGAKLTNQLNISTTLTISTGDLDLNGQDIDLGTTGVLTEDRVNNHLVIDNTAVDDSNQGGGIIYSGVNVDNTTTEIRGTGLYLQRTSGTDYAVSVVRKHYRGAGKGIRCIYKITGFPSGTNTTMRIYYASDELAGLTGTFRLFRWQSATGWKQASDAGSGFANGTNGADYVEATGINGFSDWTIGSESSPLPISLIRFEGKRLDNQFVKLTWQTANELNNQGFEVEQSIDNQLFAKIGFVDGVGNSNRVMSYEFSVMNGNASYYRLKQVDRDGKYNYSTSVYVKGNEVDNLVFYPNPATETLNMEVDGKHTSNEIINLKVYNAQGNQIWIQTSTLTEMQSLLNTHFKSWKAGLYLIQIQTKEGIQQRKLIKY